MKRDVLLFLNLNKTTFEKGESGDGGVREGWDVGGGEG